jgi:REP element-mobilizing transposase RayT
MQELVSSGHAIGESNFHIVLTPAYRQDIFRDPLVRELTIGYIATKLQELRVQLLAYDFGPDHLHLFVANVRFVGEAELVRQIKGYSSYMMRRGHWQLFRDKLYGDKFWTYSHFYRSVGAVNKETVRKYVEESQSKHWEPVSEQRTLVHYAS